MSNFKATNSFKLTRFAFYERLRYKLLAYENINHSNLKNISFSSLNLYGKINNNYDAVYPDKEFIKQTPNNKYALGVVADAFSSVIEHFRRANNLERIDPNQKFLTDIKCHSGYIDPLDLYNSYINNVLDIFNKDYLKVNEIKSFDDYLHFFLPYARILKAEFPITFSGWIKSKRCSPFISGLYLNVSNENFGDDPPKEQHFINSPNFNFYLDTCKSRGFYVAKSNPSILIADINSTPMKNRINAGKGGGTIFNNSFKQAYQDDMRLLSLKLIEYYNTFLNNRQQLFIQKISKDNKVYTSIEYINNNNINNINKFNNIKYKLYINIKNIEENLVYGQADIDQFVIKAKKIENIFDNSTAIDYINIKFRSTYASKYGGLNYYNKKFDSMEG
jgi:hypothetical protein